MRSHFFGIALAVVVTAGVAVVAAASPTPEQAAANSVQPGFSGVKQIGAWRLLCFKLRGNPAAPAKPVQTSVIHKGGQQMLNVRMYVPPRPCNVIGLLKSGDRPERQTTASFVIRGPYGVLVMFFRAPVELFPGDTISPAALMKKSRDAASGDTKPSNGATSNSYPGEEFVTLDYDGASEKGPLKICGPYACVAAIKIPRQDEPKFLATKHLAIEFPAFPKMRPVRMDLPVSGVAEAIGAMRRLEK